MRLQSGFAILDVQRGRVGLRKKIEKGEPVPVIIRGVIDTVHGHDDGVSREFGVIVTHIDTKA